MAEIVHGRGRAGTEEHRQECLCHSRLLSEEGLGEADGDAEIGAAEIF